MSENVTVLRAWDRMVITAWWDTGDTATATEPWLNIRAFKLTESGSMQEKSIRLSLAEAGVLEHLIKQGLPKKEK
jgi:hypothetical protein